MSFFPEAKHSRPSHPGCGWISEGEFGPNSDVLVISPQGDGPLTTLEGFCPSRGAVVVTRNHQKECLLVATEETGGELYTLPGKSLMSSPLLSRLERAEMVAGVATSGVERETGVPVYPQELGAIILGGFNLGHNEVAFETDLRYDDLRLQRDPIPGEGVIEARWFKSKEVPELQLTEFTREVLATIVKPLSRLLIP